MMERVSVLCLSLLLCSLSGAELQGNEIIEQDKPEGVNVPEQPQPCPSDLHAVLQEMNSKLAKHQVRIEQLQTLNQEQAVKLKELEKPTNEVESMKAQLQEKLRELEMQTRDVDTMKRQLQVHTEDLKSFQEILNVTKTEVETVKRDKAVGQVAFSAGLFTSGAGYIGPYNTDSTLVFRHVISNVGNAYNPNTGLFIAPVRGAYHFEFYIGAGGHDGHAASVKLTKNGEHVVHAYEHQTDGYGGTANGATLVLEPRDVVSLILTENDRILYTESHRSSYSGHLLFTMYG